MSNTAQAMTSAGRIAEEAHWDDDGGAERQRPTTTPGPTHDYRYWLTVPGGRSACRIRIFRVGRRTVGIATQRQDKFGGTALSGNAATLATQVKNWHHPLDDDQFTWVEQYEFPRDDGPHGVRETFAEVRFEHAADGSLSAPQWQPTDRDAIEQLLGQPLGE